MYISKEEGLKIIAALLLIAVGLGWIHPGLLLIGIGLYIIIQVIY